MFDASTKKPAYYLKERINWGYAIQTKVTIATCVQNASKASGDEKVSAFYVFNFFRLIQMFQVSKVSRSQVPVVLRTLCYALLFDLNHPHLLAQLQ